MFGWSKWEKLLKAAKDGDLDGVRQILENKTEQKRRSIIYKCLKVDLKSPLYWAIYYEHENVAQYLVSFPDKYEKEATYFFAAGCGDLKTIKYLLDNGVDVNMRHDSMKIGALHCAVYGNQLETVRYLVSRGADIEIKDDQNKTPLHTAIFERNIELVRYFLENGADVFAKFLKYVPIMDADGKQMNMNLTPYELASSINTALGGCEDIKTLLKEYEGKQKQDKLVCRIMNMPTEQLAQDLKSNGSFFDDVHNAGHLEKAVERLTYNQAIPLYQCIQERINGVSKIRIQQIIRDKRRHERN